VSCGVIIGQRYDVIFEANQAVGNYWMRAVPAADCSAQLNPDGIRAIVKYKGCKSNAEPTSTPYPITSTECVDETGLVPIVHRDLGVLSLLKEEDINVIQDQYIKFTINNSSLLIDWSDPTLLMVENHDPTYPSHYNVQSLNGTADTVRSYYIWLIDSGRMSSFNPSDLSLCLTQ